MTFEKIGKICKISSGGTPLRTKNEYYIKGNIKWVKSGDLKSKYLYDTNEYITTNALANSSAKLFPPNTVLIAMYGATIGACSILAVEAATNQACAALLPSKRFYPEYMYYYINYKKDEIILKGVGGAQPNISATILKDILIPLPPLETQKKIVAILDKAQALIDARKEQIRLMDELIQSVFYEMFGDPVTNPKGWEVGTINDLTKKTQYGTSKKAHETDGEYPVLRMNNITYSGGLKFSSLKYVDLDEKELEKYLVYTGELLFNRTNSKELVGKTAVYRKTKPMAYAGYLVKLKANSRGNTEYISAYLNSQHGKATLLNMAKSIVGMANINAEELKKIKINLPPVEIQNNFAVIVTEIEEKKKQLAKALDDYELNFKSIMQKAFNGSLFLN